MTTEESMAEVCERFHLKLPRFVSVDEAEDLLESIATRLPSRIEYEQTRQRQISPEGVRTTGQGIILKGRLLPHDSKYRREYFFTVINYLERDRTDLDTIYFATMCAPIEEQNPKDLTLVDNVREIINDYFAK